MKELSVDLEVIIINLMSQIPMSIWLYNDGRTVIASTGTNVVISWFVQSLHLVPSFLSCLHVRLQLLHCHSSYPKLRSLPLHPQLRMKPEPWR